MKWFFVVFCLVGCGGEDVCSGPEGEFSGIPTLEANTCVMTPPFLKETGFDTVKLTPEQKLCGWSELLQETREVDGCTRKVIHKLTVTEEGYKGSVVLEVDCGDSSRCAAIWHVDFEPR